MARSTVQVEHVGGVEAFFAALDALTYREMREVALLLALQVEGVFQGSPDRLAEALADASDSYSAADDED